MSAKAENKKEEKSEAERREEKQQERLDELYEEYEEVIDFFDFELGIIAVDEGYELSDAIGVTEYCNTIDEVQSELEEAEGRMKQEIEFVTKQEEDRKKSLDEAIEEMDYLKKRRED